MEQNTAGQIQKTRKPRKTQEDKERELQQKIAAMESRLNKLKQTRIDRQAKKLDKIWLRLRVKMLDMGLGDVDEAVLEKLITDNAALLLRSAKSDE